MFKKILKYSFIILILAQASISLSQSCYSSAYIYDDNCNTTTVYQFYATTQTKVKIVATFYRGTSPSGTFSELNGAYVHFGVGSSTIKHWTINYLNSTDSYISFEEEFILTPNASNYYLAVYLPNSLGEQCGSGTQYPPNDTRGKHMNVTARLYYEPVIYPVSGGGNRCSNSSPTRIYMNNSQAGVSYQLKKGTQNIGTSQSGNGSVIEWFVSDPGTYNVIATHTSSACQATMGNTVSVTERPAPTKYYLLGTASRCDNEGALQLTLSGSQLSTRYQLMRGSEEIGNYVEGTGSALTWNVEEAGTYHVVAISYEIIPQGPVTIYHCSETMNGTPTITVNQAPAIYPVSGGGIRCSEDPVLSINLGNSQSGIDYYLYRNDVNQNINKTGQTGSPLSWTGLTQTGLYKVKAVNSTKQCSNWMSNSASITTNLVPNTYSFSGNGTRCENGSGLVLTLSGSQSGIKYQLMRGFTPVGIHIDGDGTAKTWTQTVAGTYSVIASNPVTGCTKTMSGTPVITVNPAPVIYPVSGGGTRCADDPKLTVNLGNSQTDFDYYLYLDGVDQNNIKDGTGSALIWNDLETPGVYRVKAIHPTTQCSNWMSNSATIITNPNPTINVTSNQNFTVYPGSPTTTLTASGASEYEWAPNENISVTSGSVVKVYPSISKNYTVEGISTDGCKGIKNIRITYILDIIFSINPEKGKGNEIMASARGGVPPYTFVWNNGTVSNKIAPNKDGTYSVTVTDSEGSSHTKSYELSYYSSSDKNYIHTYSPREKMEEIPENFERDEITEVVQYFDGLGRLEQIVNTAQNPDGNSLVQIIDYDAFSRETKKYLPYVADASGKFVSKSTWLFYHDKRYDTYFPGEGIYAFAETEFELSPLNRVLRQGSPGHDWQLGQGHEVEFAYETNTANDIIIWEVNESITEVNSNLVSNSGSFYAAGQLYVTKTTDENKHWTREYKNMAGQVIMTESMPITGTPGNIRTYYVYDDLELLRCVIPPKAESTVNDDLCYFYRYDGKRRMIVKKIPGADAIYMVYDNRNRLVLTQDGNMRDKTPKQWMATKYEDTFNRPILTGIIEDDRSHEAIITDLDSDVEYAFPAIENMELLSKTYYDAYSNIDFDLTHYGFENAFSLGNSSSNLKGQIVATITYVPETGQELKTVNYYDRKYRVIQTTGDNHLDGKDVISTHYDFTGQVLETKQVHYKDTKTVISNAIDKRFDYDHAGRLKKVEMKLDTEAEYHIVAENTYNALGQLIDKNAHWLADNSYLLNTIYNYNIRGWMTGAVSTNKETTLFDFGLHYETGATPIFNGNISRMTWNSSQLDGTKSYEYSYNEINELTGATFTGATDESYTTSYGYDKNGNIKTLVRNGFMGTNGFGVIDNLTYAYQGNCLIGVNDVNDPANLNHQAFGFKDNGKFKNAVAGDITSHEYLYDLNGNLTTDLNKGINQIRYNHLNLPDFVLQTGSNAIDYIYDAAGVKLKQIVYKEGSIVKETDYVGNFVYENSSLKFILTDDGRLVPNGSGFDYEYFIKDHLGNNRVTVADQNNDGIAEVMQEDHYYPFGMAMEGMSYQNPLQQALNRYLFNGKELQDDLGLNWYAYGFRMYDPVLGRFPSIDPIADQFVWVSPYNYAENDPIANIDLHGLQKVSVIAGEIVGNDQQGFINSATPEMRDQKPFLAGIKDASYIGLNLMVPLDPIDDAIAAFRDDDATITDKINAGIGALLGGLVGKGKYGKLKQPKTVGEGKNFTRAQKNRILKENMKNNGGELKSDLSGKKLNPPKQSKKGKKADMNQAEIDHVDPKSKGGSNSNSNAQVLSKEENLKKTNK